MNRCQRCCLKFNDEVLTKMVKALIVILYLLVQETALAIYASLLFVSPPPSISIAVAVIYLHILLFVLSCAFYYRLDLFQDHRLLYIYFAKKLILPVMVIIPNNYHYLLLVFMAALFLA